MVEDNEIYALRMKQSLFDAFGIETELFPNIESLVNYSTESPDIILLDYYLEHKNLQVKQGIEGLKWIKSQFPASHVVMVSGLQDPKQIEETLCNGAAMFIDKGTLDYTRVIEMVEDFLLDLEKQEKRREARKEKRQRKISQWALMVSVTLMFLVLIRLLC